MAKKKSAIRSSQSVLDMSAEEAAHFFLKAESYCNVDLPPYFDFQSILKEVEGQLLKSPLKGSQDHSPRAHDNVNHTILNNKDGKYAWRPLQLCHPALYVSLVKELTSKKNWKLVLERFREFTEDPKIQCLSIPVESRTRYKDKAEQVLRWWHEIEQRSIELSLDFEILIHADISDCYGSIYTHSIAWAIHSKKIAKEKRNDSSLIGNAIDSRIQDMRHGQTNGIPQGSVLMDFIAEIVLGYADMKISQAIKNESIDDFRILRYRDDYRIFANNSQDGECILRCISEVLACLGFKLNTSKTIVSSEVVTDSIKADKTEWLQSLQRSRDLEKHLLIIHQFSRKHPNSGSLMRALTEYHRRISRVTKSPRQIMPLISIVVDIAYHSPKVYPITMAILSKLLSLLANDTEKVSIVAKVLKRFQRIPNTGYLEVWLQRVALPFDETRQFSEPLCQLVNGDDVQIWDSSWISSKPLKKKLGAQQIVRRDKIDDLKDVIAEDEVQLFDY